MHAFGCRCEDLPTRLLIRRANSNMVCSSGFPWEHIPLKKPLLPRYTRLEQELNVRRSPDSQDCWCYCSSTAPGHWPDHWRQRERERRSALQAQLGSDLICSFHCIMDAACIWFMCNHKNTIAFFPSLKISLIIKNTEYFPVHTHTQWQRRCYSSIV